jgi:hypothetical protein
MENLSNQTSLDIMIQVFLEPYSLLPQCAEQCLYAIEHTTYSRPKQCATRYKLYSTLQIAMFRDGAGYTIAHYSILWHMRSLPKWQCHSLCQLM